MTEFFVSLSKEKMAHDIASMLNSFNKLYKVHTVQTILSDNTDYFVEVDGGKVVACVGLKKREPQLSELRHLCVVPSKRRLGLAGNLILLAMSNCSTDYVYMTIREDNIPSLKLAKSLGFVFVDKKWRLDHNVITVGRKGDYEQQRSHQS